LQAAVHGKRFLEIFNNQLRAELLNREWYTVTWRRAGWLSAGGSSTASNDRTSALAISPPAQVRRNRRGSAAIDPDSPFEWHKFTTKVMATTFFSTLPAINSKVHSEFSSHIWLTNFSSRCRLGHSSVDKSANGAQRSIHEDHIEDRPET
jgi:hypothetical protein